jgi:hypothetical protein
VTSQHLAKVMAMTVSSSFAGTMTGAPRNTTSHNDVQDTAMHLVTSQGSWHS